MIQAGSPPAPARGVRPSVVLALPAAAALSIYLLTLAPGPLWGDGAELALAAHRLGVTHAPGYPVHTVLGHLFTRLAGEPILGTNLLSAVASAGTIWLLARLAFAVTGQLAASALGALVLAFTAPFWKLAIVTEIYNVNAMFIAGTLLALASWPAGAAGFVAGLSLGASFANLLLAPGALVLLVSRSRERGGGRSWAPDAARFAAVALVTAAVLVTWSVVRARALPPLGNAFVPDSFEGLLSYLSGAQYRGGVLAGPFLPVRVREHVEIFLAAFHGAGLVPAALGLGWLVRSRRSLATATLLVFAANFGYFTFHPYPDYHTMATASYVVFALWIAVGLGVIWAFRPSRARGVGRIAAIALGVGLVATGVARNLEPVAERAGATERVRSFVTELLATVPDSALVVAKWHRFTPLVYEQAVHGTRPDVTIIERGVGPRESLEGLVPSWEARARAEAARRVVIVDPGTPAATAPFRLVPFDRGWSRLVREP